MIFSDYRVAGGKVYVEEWLPVGRSAHRARLLVRTDALLDRTDALLAEDKKVSIERTARSEPLVPKPALKDRVVGVLEVSAYDWLTPVWIARQLEASESDVRAILAALTPIVRRPVGATGAELDCFRLSAKPLTWQERLRKLRAIVTGTTLAGSQF